MIRSFRYFIFLFCYLISHLAQADAVLIGSMTIGDGNTAALSPTTLFSYTNSTYVPNNPIHFNLSQSGTITAVTINQATSFNYGATFIVWNSSGNIVINSTASDSSPATITGTWSLTAGDYRMAVFGACLQKNGNAKNSISSCINPNGQQQWQDISFTNITLSGVNTSSVNFIQRQHIGDTSNLTRIYPPTESGSSAIYAFTVSATTSLTSVMIYGMQDSGILDDWLNYFNDDYRIRIKKTTSSQYLFDNAISNTVNSASNQRVNLLFNQTVNLAVGDYQLIIEPTNSSILNWYYDDIAWDDIVLTAKSTSATDHYQIEYVSNNLSCVAAPVTIKACSTSGTTCTTDSTANTSLTLSSPATGWVTNPVTLVNGVGTTSLNHYTAESVSVGLSGLTPVCVIDGKVDPTCKIPFVSAAFSFNIPTFYAGATSGNVVFKALQASTTNPTVCTPLFASKTQNINFTNQFVLPTTAGSDTPKLNNVAITTNTPVPLAFDSTGAVNIVMAYNDAGVLGVSAAYSKTDAAAGTLNIAGSDNVAVLPDSIKLTAVGQKACSGTNDQTYAACSAYQKVGDTFMLSAQAGYSSGSTFTSTNNFTPQSTSAKPSLQHKIAAPLAGTLPSSWANTALTFSSGTASSTVNEGDVGVYLYQVIPFVPYPSYQDEATKLTVPKSALSWSDPVGRIFPAKLQATVTANGSLTTDTCAANLVTATLGYTGQPLRFSTSPTVSVTALGSDGVTVMKNYLGEFAKITSTDAASSGNFVAALLPKNSANSLTSSASWGVGAWSVPVNAYTPVYAFSASDQFTFNKTSAPVTPFESALAVTTLADSDGVSAATSLPLNFYPTTPTGSAFKIYSGRLLAENVNGADNSALTLPFYLQYWNGSAYVLNTADNCSTLATHYLSMNAASNWSGIALKTSSSTTSSAITNATLSPAAVVGGVGNILFSAPNASGWVDIAAGAALPLWMQDLSQATGLNPARASFGFYRGNDRVIYRREVFSSQ